MYIKTINLNAIQIILIYIFAETDLYDNFIAPFSHRSHSKNNKKYFIYQSKHTKMLSSIMRYIKCLYMRKNNVCPASHIRVKNRIRKPLLRHIFPKPRVIGLIINPEQLFFVVFLFV